MSSYIGVDIGGTSAKCGLVTQDGQILKRCTFPTGVQTDPETFASNAKAAIRQLWREDVAGIGMGCPGFIDPATGVIHGGIENLPGLDGCSLPQLLQPFFPDVPITLLNDLNAVALGELWMGAGRDTSNFACLAFGTGLGGAIVLDGKVLNGCHFRAGEVGYLDYRDETDYLELSVSTIGLVRTAAEALGDRELHGRQFFALYRQKDPVCVRLFDAWLERVSRTVANIILVLDVDKIIIGGGISAQSDILIPALEERVNDMLPVHSRNQCRIVAAQQANDAGLLGAVRQLMDAITE